MLRNALMFIFLANHKSCHILQEQKYMVILPKYHNFLCGFYPYIIMLNCGDIIAYLGLLNGMIGGTILVLPLMARDAGYILVPLINLLVASMSCYTLFITMSHLGECKNIRESILEHFNNAYYSIVTYNILLSLNLLGSLMVYFRLIIQQLNGFVPPSPYIDLGVFLFLFIITIASKKFRYAQKLLAIGIFTVLSYCFFIGWAQITAPKGQKVVQSIGTGGIDLAASLIMGYTTHDFAAQLFTKIANPSHFKKIVIYGYITGWIIYTYISYGCFAIINRLATVPDPETITQYFSNSGWEIKFIEIIYLIHLLTVSPEFCIIMKGAILQILKKPQTNNLNWLEIVLILGIFGICYLVQTLGIQIATIIELRGSVLGFAFIFLLPILIHIKCVFFSKHDYEGYMLAERPNEQTGEIIEFYGNCKCKLDSSSNKKYWQLAIQVIVLIIGFAIMVYTLKGLFFEESTAISQSLISKQHQELSL